MKHSRFHEKVEILRKSRDFKTKLRIRFKCSEKIRVREAFRVAPAVTKVDSLLRVVRVLRPSASPRFLDRFSALGFFTRLTMSAIVGGCISRSGDGYPLHYEER